MTSLTPCPHCGAELELSVVSPPTQTLTINGVTYLARTDRDGTMQLTPLPAGAGTPRAGTPSAPPAAPSPPSAGGSGGTGPAAARTSDQSPSTPPPSLPAASLPSPWAEALRGWMQLRLSLDGSEHPDVTLARPKPYVEVPVPLALLPPGNERLRAWVVKTNRSPVPLVVAETILQKYGSRLVDQRQPQVPLPYSVLSYQKLQSGVELVTSILARDGQVPPMVTQQERFRGRGKKRWHEIALPAGLPPRWRVWTRAKMQLAPEVVRSMFLQAFVEAAKDDLEAFRLRAGEPSPRPPVLESEAFHEAHSSPGRLGREAPAPSSAPAAALPEDGTLRPKLVAAAENLAREQREHAGFSLVRNPRGPATWIRTATLTAEQKAHVIAQVASEERGK